ncbi:MAG TPA: acetyl-CoA carboxylase carboxyltransferase subunit alpha [Candidatus Competibacter sp.]|nr:acetyl-CoA carboxylase carboxyltransferase subunit alpha [Candidatus Competibacter sp.]HUM92031.1 acetyl-CoA carboxylase carboxyltransferase subunit alpha [Candidatus Competibacter sp.]
MNPNNCLDFEKPIAELEAMLQELRNLSAQQDLNISDEIARLEAKSKALTESIFASLTSWQISQIARHPLRPYTLDYVERLFTDFQELHGDRMFADDHAIIGGLARLDGRAVLVIGHQKGRDTKEKIYRNFGMPRPEGYRKALRLMKLAEQFQLPVLTFIDTPGAYPGIGAEERGQSEAIARNLFEMSRLRTPIICMVIGEGGSGGALAVGVGDRVLMLQYGTYAVISPEGCAAILWKSAEKAPEAAEAMSLTADRLLKLNLIDGIIPEPPGGAHRDVTRMAENVRTALRESLQYLDTLGMDDLLEQRYQRLMAYGMFKEAEPATSAQSSWQSSVAALLGKDKDPPAPADRPRHFLDL